MNKEASFSRNAAVLCLHFENGPGDNIVDKFECTGVGEDDKEKCGEEWCLDLSEIHDIWYRRKKIYMGFFFVLNLILESRHCGISGSVGRTSDALDAIFSTIE